MVLCENGQQRISFTINKDYASLTSRDERMDDHECMSIGGIYVVHGFGVSVKYRFTHVQAMHDHSSNYKYYFLSAT